MIKSIEAHSRVSFKQTTKSGDVFYTYEYSEVRDIPQDSNITEERIKLWDDINNEINKQITETKNLYKQNSI